MKKLQSVLCALALAIALSPTALAGDGDIHGGGAPGDIHGAPGDIHGIKGEITGIYGILLTDLLVIIFGDIHG